MALPGLVAGDNSYGWPTLPITAGKVVALTESLIDAGMTYGLGAKIEPLSLQAAALAGHTVDCSGFVRWCIYHATGGVTELVDGSASQHQQIEDLCFKASSPLSARTCNDDIVRIAFLRPDQSPENIGHVLLIVNGMTCESHGGKGPDRRVWGSRPYHNFMDVYALSRGEK